MRDPHAPDAEEDDRADEIREALAAYLSRRRNGALCFGCLRRIPIGPDMRDGGRCADCRESGVRVMELPPYRNRNNVGRRAGRPEPTIAPTIASIPFTRPAPAAPTEGARRP